MKLIFLLATILLTGCTNSWTMHFPTHMTLQSRVNTVGLIENSPSNLAGKYPMENINTYSLMAPDGFQLIDSELKVEPGFDHKILGRVKVLKKYKKNSKD